MRFWAQILRLPAKNVRTESKYSTCKVCDRMVQAVVDQYGLLQEFFDPGLICSDSVQVELNPNKTVQVDLEHRARFPILNTLTQLSGDSGFQILEVIRKLRKFIQVSIFSTQQPDDLGMMRRLLPVISLPILPHFSYQLHPIHPILFNNYEYRYEDVKCMIDDTWSRLVS